MCLFRINIEPPNSLYIHRFYFQFIFIFHQLQMVKLRYIGFEQFLITDGENDLKILEIQTRQNHIVCFPSTSNTPSSRHPHTTCFHLNDTVECKYHDAHWDRWFKMIGFKTEFMRFLHFRIDIPTRVDCLWSNDWHKNGKGVKCCDIPIEIFDIMEQQWRPCKSDNLVDVMLQIQSKLENFIVDLDLNWTYCARWSPSTHATFCARWTPKPLVGEQKQKKDDEDALSFVDFASLRNQPDIPPPPYE